MNKGELIEALAVRLGDKRAATDALEAVLAEIQAAVTRGEKVTITGFGVFEKRVRAARTARNPRTGERVRVKKTSVPAFRPGTTFKETVASGRVPKALKAPATKAAKKTAPPTRKAAKAPARKIAAKAAPARKTATKAPAPKTTAKAPAKTAKKTAPAARKTTTKAPAGKAATKTTGRKTTATKTPAKRTAKKTTARR